MKNTYRPATVLVHQGADRDPTTGASTIPIYQASTYHHFDGESGEFDYARGGNPSRQQPEDAIALLEGGVEGFGYASGMAAIAGALSLLEAGDHLIAPADLYGGTYRYLTRILPPKGIDTSFVDTTDLKQIEAALTPKTRAIFLETPANPLCSITDLQGAAELAKAHSLLTIVDNTFMTPLLQKPLELGCDIVLHSATKFLGGHSDLLAGLATTADPELALKLKLWNNSTGAVLAPFDSFLLARGIKTLKLRLEASQANASILATRLAQHPAVQQVIYPGLPDHPGRDLHDRQARGAGAVLAFDLGDQARATRLMQRVRLPIIAPSLGGVETILTHCWSMSHAAIPAPVKRELGIGPGLMRLSAGIEDVEDLWLDLEQGLKD